MIPLMNNLDEFSLRDTVMFANEEIDRCIMGEGDKYDPLCFEPSTSFSDWDTSFMGSSVINTETSSNQSTGSSASIRDSNLLGAGSSNASATSWNFDTYESIYQVHGADRQQDLPYQLNLPLIPFQNIPTMQTTAPPLWKRRIREQSQTPQESELTVRRNKREEGEGLNLDPLYKADSIINTGKNKKTGLIKSKHFKDDNSRYPCKYSGCMKTFSTSGHATRHERVHTGSRSYSCPHEGCSANFTRKDNCTQHQSSKHSYYIPSTATKDQ